MDDKYGRTESLGLSRVELAQRSGAGYRFLYDLERGKVTVRNDKVEVLR